MKVGLSSQCPCNLTQQNVHKPGTTFGEEEAASSTPDPQGQLSAAIQACPPAPAMLTCSPRQGLHALTVLVLQEDD